MSDAGRIRPPCKAGAALPHRVREMVSYGWNCLFWQGADSISTEPKASVVGASMRGAAPGHGNVAHAECEQSIDIQWQEQQGILGLLKEERH